MSITAIDARNWMAKKNILNEELIGSNFRECVNHCRFISVWYGCTAYATIYHLIGMTQHSIEDDDGDHADRLPVWEVKSFNR